MKKLGFKTVGNTKFSNEQSGGVAWGGNLKGEEFLNHIATVDDEPKKVKEKFLGLYKKAKDAGAE